MSDRTPAGADEKTLWITRCPVPTATGLAYAQGWFDAAFAPLGWKVETLQEARNANLRLAHFRHDLLGLVREGGNIPPIWARADGADTVVVGLTWVDERQAVLAWPGADVRALSDLRGKRLGVVRTQDPSTDFQRAMSLHGFATTLKLAGLAREDVEIVEYPQPEPQGWNAGPRANAALEGLLKGEVDVIYAKGAQGAALEREYKLDLVIDLNTHSDPKVRINNGTPRPVTFHREFLGRHRDIVVRYLAVLLQTSTWAESRAAETRRILASETGTDEASVLVGYGPDLNRSLDVNLSEERVEALEIQKNFLRDWDQIPGDFDARAWIDAGPLAEARELIASGAAPIPAHQAA